MNGNPPQETPIDTALVRALLQEQHPDLATAPLSALAEGWDNVIFRLGDACTVRLPRRQASAALIEHEQQWLPKLALPLWLHGDLHPLNLLVERGQLSAVIDFGDMCAGDPACDLSVAWMLLPPHARRHLRATLAVDDATWQRAQAWALALGVAFASGDERIASVGQRTLAAALADAGLAVR